MNLFVTGGAGFIGSNFIRYMLQNHSDCTIINYDKLTYAGNLENLEDVQSAFGEPGGRYRFIKGDIADPAAVNDIFSSGIDAVVNFAAESHVDRSIDNCGVFIETNIGGVQVLLDAALRSGIKKFVQISTDEVYGSLGPEGKFTETTPLAPNSPYSASKAGADLLVRAYFETHGLPAVITRCSNNYGPYQFPEKLIPLFITNALSDKTLPLYGDGLNVRDWIHVEDHCAAIDRVLRSGKDGQVYNIGGDCEKTNRQITDTILRILNKPDSLVSYIKDRPGHDRRYAIDNSRIRSELGWAPRYGFESGIQQTVDWYVNHAGWWQRIKTGAYLDFYRRWYEERQ